MREPVDGRAGASTRAIRPAVRFVIGGRRRALALMTAMAFAGGLAEALFLVTVTRTAFAITAGRDSVGVVAGRVLSLDRTLLFALGLLIARIALAAASSWQAARLAATVVASLRRTLAAAFLGASWEAQQAERSGSLQELLSGYAGQASGLMGGLSQGLVAVANLVALLAMAVAVDPVGALVLVVSVGILGSCLRPLRALVRRRAEDAARVRMEFATTVSEVSELGLELHVFNVQEAARSRIGRLIDRARDSQRRLQFVSGLSSPLYTGLAYLALLGALAVVAASDATNLTSLGASMLVMLRSLSYGQAAQTAHTNVSANVPTIEELQRRLRRFEDARPAAAHGEVGAVGTITVTGLSFAYIPDEEVLHDLSFTIQPREVVGIVGPSGGGKSTLVQLLLGLREPGAGTIRVGDRDVATLDRAEWARKVTFVPQMSRLIAGSIADNIRFLRQGVTAEDIERAARLAHLHDDVVALPGGYDRAVGEHGGHLSGGQQQRLCLARALVEDPDVLILDEPTSSLDARSEHLVRQTLGELRERMTVIVIAHRLSTLDICDRIMVIQDGQLRGFDTPHDLAQTNEFYREALILSGLR